VPSIKQWYLHFDNVVAVGDFLAVELNKGEHTALAAQLHLVVHILAEKNRNITGSLEHKSMNLQILPIFLKVCFGANPFLNRLLLKIL